MTQRHLSIKMMTSCHFNKYRVLLACLMSYGLFHKENAAHPTECRVFFIIHIPIHLLAINKEQVAYFLFQ